jgi:iron complex outermembrane recepter protein
MNTICARRGHRALFIPMVIFTSPLLAQAPEPPVDRDDESNTRLDAVVVTGTRIPRIQIEGPLPISVIDREELLRRGQRSVSEAIRDLPWNTFGSFGEMPNSSSPNVSLPQLRGLGSKYTLTLIDGQRLPGFANLQGGAAASVTGIPLGAIDRIEVLRDGASAIYGSDAIGGVINLITRREDTAPQFELQLEQPSDDGGDAWRASFVTSHAFTRGHLLLALEAQDREPLLGAQRDYLLANAAFSPSGNPGSFRRIDPATGNFFGFFEPDPRCPERFDSDPLFPSSEARALGPNRFCVYRFRDLNMERAGYEARSLFLSARHELGERLTGFARVLGIDGDGLTQLAPAPAGLLRLAADNPNNPTLGERGPGLGWPIVLNYRLTALGPRVTAIEERTWHLLAGVEGLLDWGDGGDWQLTAFRNRYDGLSEGIAGYALRDAFSAALASGRFDPFTAEPGNPRGLEDAAFVPWDRGRSRADGIELAFTLDAPLFDRFAASYAFGFDLRRDTYSVTSDPATGAGRVIGQGQAPAPEGASRNYGALYGEWFMPLSARWEFSLAARYDHYQDAGARVSPKLALAFRPGATWLLRGSLGRGFQAPDLVSAYGGSVIGFAFEVDPTACAARPGDPIACELRPSELNIVPNPTLGPERAHQGQFGVMWQPSAQFDLALDYVHTRIEGQIDTLPAADALQAELDCARGVRSCNPLRDGRVLRDDFGNIERIVVPWINVASARADALDAEANWRLDSGIGNFSVGLRGSRVLRFERQRLATLPVEDQLGAIGRPRWRGELRLDWQRGAHGASAGLKHVDGYGSCLFVQRGDGPRNPDCDRRVRSHSELDAQWRWRAPWSGEFALGGRNLRNRPPAFDHFGGYAHGLYDVTGRIWYLRYRQAF